jgi:Ca2+-binding RTX toxin-like protein
MALIQGTDENDFLEGTNDSDRIYGYGGNDQIWGFGGSNIIYAGDGDDRVEGGSGLGALYGGAGDDQISGGQSSDQIFGGGGNDNLWGADNFDQVYGESGHDVISDSEGGDYLDGGAGIDTLVISYLEFVTTTPPITFVFDPASGPVETRYGGTAVNFEQINFTGGNSGDHITGGDRNDLLRGWGGNDTLFGGDGDDFIIGDNGNDEIHGGAGNDLLTGNGGSDVISGGAGDDELIGGRPFDVFGGHDVLEGGGGADHFVGGNGQTDLSFVNAKGGVTVDLVQRIGTRGEALGDTYDASIGGAVLGSIHGDVFIGGLYQHGNGGNDELIAGSSTRTMTGGDGRDFFGFRFNREVLFDTPTVTDFDQSLNEKIDLSATDAKPWAGDQRFKFIGTDAFSGKAGELRYEVIGDQTFIQMTLDQRGGYDATIVLDGVHTLTAQDFFL